MPTTETLPDECIHGLVGGCVTCEGTDPMTEDRYRKASRGLNRQYSEEDLKLLQDYSKTSREVAAAIGRSVNQVSAERIGRFGMRDYAGYYPRPNRKR